jgi:alkanesulfonate monooxygenase SsuD/methylene tetrahydromethanopterin reductase-like flavin-dependent oxidoreductase (luciferase family)
MRLAARFADSFVTAWHTSPAGINAIFGALGEACRDVGREPTTIGRVVGTFVALGPGANTSGRRSASLQGSPQAIAEQLEALHAAGADYLVCMVSPGGRRGVERFAEVIAALRDTP